MEKLYEAAAERGPNCKGGIILCECDPPCGCHPRLIEYPNEFRSKVGQECLWSIPTYYRKIKSDTGNSQK